MNTLFKLALLVLAAVPFIFFYLLLVRMEVL